MTISLPSNLYNRPGWIGFAFAAVFSLNKYPIAARMKQGLGFSHMVICQLKTNLGCMNPLLYYDFREEDVLTSLHQRAFLWESIIQLRLLSPEWSECTWVEFSFVNDSLDVSALKCGIELVFHHNLEEFTLAQCITSCSGPSTSNERLPFDRPDKFSDSDSHEDQANGTSSQYSYEGAHTHHQLYQTTTEDFHPSSSYNCCFPPSKIQDWFSHQNHGHLVTMDLPSSLYHDSNWMGLVLYVSFSIHGDPNFILSHLNSGKSHSLYCQCQMSMANVDDQAIAFSTNKEEITWLLEVGEFIWISYVPGEPFKNMLQHCSHIEATFVSDWSGVIVQNCALQLLYKRDQVLFEQELKHCNNLIYENRGLIHKQQEDQRKRNEPYHVDEGLQRKIFSNIDFGVKLFPRLIDQSEIDETETELGQSDLLIPSMAFLNNKGAFSSSFTCQWKYDVFLSSRGEDTHKSVNNHLYLYHKGIYTFINDKLKKGEEISEELIQAINNSRFAIIVFENYTTLKWCLDELVEIVEHREKDQEVQIRPIFYSVNPSKIQKQKRNFGIALANQENKFENNKDYVQRWRDALGRVANASGRHYNKGCATYRYESHFIQNVFEEISNAKLNWTSLYVAKYLVGINSRAKAIESLLDIGLGLPGVGKTTITKAVRIAKHFDGSSFLEDVRERSRTNDGILQLQQQLLHDILRDGNWRMVNKFRGVSLIEERICYKKVFSILDDVNDSTGIENLQDFDQCQVYNSCFPLCEIPEWFNHRSDDRITHFYGSNFLEDVREKSRTDDGILQLQERLLNDILRDGNWRVVNKFRGISLIEERLCYKKVFSILDDVNDSTRIENLQDFDQFQVYNSCFPLCEIPEWFNHRSDEPLLTIPLPPYVYNDSTWMGLALFASVAVEANQTTILDIQNSETSYSLFGHLETSIECVEPLHVHHITKEDLKLLQQGGFIWLSYIPRDSFKESLNQCSRIEASVTINCPGLVQKCGFHLLYKHDEVEFKETIRQYATVVCNEQDVSAKISSSSNEDPQSEPVEPADWKDKGKGVLE